MDKKEWKNKLGFLAIPSALLVYLKMQGFTLNSTAS